MNLLLVDNRVSQVELVKSACLPNVIPIIVDYYGDTFETILEKIPAQLFDSIGIFQENYSQPNYQFLNTATPALLNDQTFSSWTPFIEFFNQVREKTNMTKIDMMGCNIGADANWIDVLEHIQTSLGVQVTSSVDTTGSESLGGNWILETGNTNLIGKYFTEAIRSYEFILGPTSTHALLLTTRGEVYSAGSNTNGCSGLGSAYTGYTTVSEFIRLPVSDISGVFYGTSTTFLLTKTREVLCSGANANGQLGLGNTTAQTDLSFVRTGVSTRLTNVASVAAGDSHAVFVLTDGSALTCGLNTSGQLGDGTLTQRTYPVDVKTLAESTQPTATRLSHYKFNGNLVNELTGISDASLLGGCILTTTQVKFGSGAVVSNNGTSSTGANSGVAGTILLAPFTPSSTNFTVSFWFYCYSSNNDSVWELLWQSAITSSSRTYAIYMVNGTSLNFYKIISGVTTSTAITVSFTRNVWNHIAIVASSITDDVKCYFNNSLAATVSGGNPFLTATYDVNKVLGVSAVALSKPYAYLDEFRIYDSALNAINIGYLYNMTNPVSANLNTIENISSISCGRFHTLLRTQTNIVYSFGQNTNGQLGNGTLVDSSFALPVKSTSLTNITQINCGGSHSLARTSAGNVYSWGENTSGQLGKNNNTDLAYATLVLTAAGATLANIVQVAAGTSHSLFLTASGTVFACGLNTSGQLGNNTIVNSNQLVSVLNPSGTAALSGINKISAIANTSFFLDNSGVLYACGSNLQNQMGFQNSGATTYYSLPVQLSLVDFGKAKTAGYSSIYNRLQGAEAWQQQYYGLANTLDFAGSGYTASQLASAGITNSVLRAAGASYRQFTSLGVRAGQLGSLYTGRNASEGIRNTTGYIMSGATLDPPGTFTISGRDTSSLTVGTITAPAGATVATVYNALATPVTGGAAINMNVSEGNPITGLAGGKIYSVRMRSVNAAGNSPYGPPVLNSTSLSALPSLNEGTITTSSIVVNFTALPIQDCSYVLRTDPNTNQYVLANQATTQTLSGLTAGATYIIILEASNAFVSAVPVSRSSTTIVPPPPIYTVNGDYTTGSDYLVDLASSQTTNGSSTNTYMYLNSKITTVKSTTSCYLYLRFQIPYISATYTSGNIWSAHSLNGGNSGALSRIYMTISSLSAFTWGWRNGGTHYWSSDNSTTFLNSQTFSGSTIYDLFVIGQGSNDLIYLYPAQNYNSPLLTITNAPSALRNTNAGVGALEYIFFGMDNYQSPLLSSKRIKIYKLEFVSSTNTTILSNSQIESIVNTA